MNHNNAGLTLLELVLAIALMSAVVLGGGWWMRTATQRATKTNALLQRESATNALFDAIECDLSTGDLATDPEKLPKVRVTSGALAFVTRSRSTSVGAVVREYSLRSATSEVVALERPVDASEGRGAAPVPRPVLGGVKHFDAEVDERMRTLSVELESVDGTSNSRRWALP